MKTLKDDGRTVILAMLDIASYIYIMKSGIQKQLIKWIIIQLPRKSKKLKINARVVN